MRFNRQSIVCPNIDIDCHDETIGISQKFEHGCEEDCRSSMRNPGLYDHFWTNIPNYFLEGNKVLWKLDDRSSQPAKIIGISVLSTSNHPFPAHINQGFVVPLFSQGKDPSRFEFVFRSHFPLICK